MHIIATQLVTASIIASPYPDCNEDSPCIISIALEPTVEGKEIIEYLAGLPRMPDAGPSFFISSADLDPTGTSTRKAYACNAPTAPHPVLNERAVFDLSFLRASGIKLTDGAIARFEISSDLYKTFSGLVGFRYEDGIWIETEVDYEQP